VNIVKSLFCIAVGYVVLFSANDVHAEKLLRWKFETGQSYDLRFTQSSHVQRTVKGKSQKLSLQTMMGLTWRIDEIDGDGNASITQTFTRLAAKMDSPTAGLVEYDTDSEEKPRGSAKDLEDALSPLVGTSLRLKISPRGEIKEVSLSDAANEAIAKAARTGKLKHLFSTEALRSMLRQSLVILPEKEVDDGAKWSVTNELASPLGKLTQENEYIYEGEQEFESTSLDKITVKSTVDLGDKPVLEDLVLKSQEQSGELWFDSERGHFKRIKIDQKMVSQRTYRDIIIDLESVAALVTTIEPSK